MARFGVTGIGGSEQSEYRAYSSDAKNART